jgi:tousled-like kinase
VKHALRESNVQKGLSHPNIVRLYDTVEIDSSSFCTVLEFCEGPDLAHYLRKHKKLPEKEAKLIIRQVINAIRYLHDLPDKVIHYDLKPQNILFHKGRVKITDFGLCKTTKEEVIELTSQGVGTYWYLPPECFETDKKAVISPKVDVWSIGVIYYEMIFGEKPFGNQMSQMRILNEGIMLKANSVNFPQTQKGLVSNESKDFIKDCLRFAAEERMDIKATATHRLFDKK